MKSMTGFGAAEGKVGKGTIFVEIKSVNHRYCDVLLKIPPKFNVLDPRMRKLIQSRIGRGKVEVFMKEKRGIEPAPVIKPNLQMAAAYQRALKSLATAIGGKAPSLLDAVDLRELVTIEEPAVQYDRYWRELQAVMQRALSQMERMRIAEGSHLKQDQMRRLASLDKLSRRIGKRAERIQTLAPSPLPADMQEPAARPLVEITEELIRLQSHIHQYRRYAVQSGPIGRQLDFLLQEMNREINTIGSKGNDAAISQLVVECKAELEKLREQVQNIE